MIRVASVFAVFFMTFTLSAIGQDKLNYNANKYPQDTPEKALASVKKALESDDVGYWICWLITSRDKTFITLNYNTIEDAAEAMIASKQVRAENAKLADAIRDLSSRAVTETGEDFGVKWVRLMIDDKNFFQLELQSDRRWCLNLRARSTAVKK